ncbi:hypothetical protein WN51_10262 [Melipona quadrifasciata]|uniref:Uncharacterized protein n=1 Tax=Melipona quadrifasciata TaxID=166423 RepID=A0A0N0BI84_9HYME|nr:hypothetical protein WN51_10262 [Melipona quadrifasciata]
MEPLFSSGTTRNIPAKTSEQLLLGLSDIERYGKSEDNYSWKNLKTMMSKILGDNETNDKLSNLVNIRNYSTSLGILTTKQHSQNMNSLLDNSDKKHKSFWKINDQGKSNHLPKQQFVSPRCKQKGANKVGIKFHENSMKIAQRKWTHLNPQLNCCLSTLVVVEAPFKPAIKEWCTLEAQRSERKQSIVYFGLYVGHVRVVHPAGTRSMISDTTPRWTHEGTRHFLAQTVAAVTEESTINLWLRSKSAKITQTFFEKDEKIRVQCLGLSEIRYQCHFEIVVANETPRVAMFWITVTLLF